MIAARQIRAPDGIFEKHIAHLGEVVFLVVIHDVPGRVSRAMDDLPCRFAHGHPVAVLKPAIWLETIHAFDAVLRRALGDVFDPKGIGLMGAFDNGARRGFQRPAAPAVIEMPMRDPYFLDRQPTPIDFGKNARYFPARVDYRAFLGLGASNEGAVLPEGRNLNDGDIDCRFWNPRFALQVCFTQKTIPLHEGI